MFFVSSASAKTDNDEVDITLIVHCCLGHPYWEPLLKGARDAAEQLGVNVDFQNAEFDPAAQVNMIEQAVANKQNAIIPMIAHPDAQTEPLIKAQEFKLLLLLQILIIQMELHQELESLMLVQTLLIQVL